MLTPDTHPRRARYLFVRVQEACNADCFFCEFALSKDPYRFPLGEMQRLAAEARDQGINVIRFTGGEPLMHPQIVELVRAASAEGHRVSMITNGVLLAQYADALIDAGLSQVILSLDSPDAETHNTYRRTPKLFERAVEGAKALKGRAVLRVNTVVGPHNYHDMPRMQEVLEDIGFEQWELSPIKLSRAVRYPDPQEVIESCRPLYETDRDGALVPLGEPFYGATPAQQDAYFEEGRVPRPQGARCHVTDDVMFLDPKNAKLFACSLLPHRDPTGIESGDAAEHGKGHVSLNTPTYRAHRDHYAEVGPSVCTGCSTTAAGYSNAIDANREPALWDY